MAVPDEANWRANRHLGEAEQSLAARRSAARPAANQPWQRVLQAAFLSPPVAMSAFYLKGVSPPHVTLNQIFAGMIPYMIIVCICMVIMYVWPGMSLWLPNYLYGGG